MLVALALTGLSTIPLPLPGTTWVVDAQGGAGADFTSLQPAFDVAARHDVILVRPGTYAAATLRVGARVLGIDTPLVQGGITVRDLPITDVAVVSRISGPFSAIDCAGAVVGDRLRSSLLLFEGSRDVRLHANEVPSSLEVRSGRVEAVECEFRGWNGPDQFCASPPDPTGRSAATVYPAGTFHAARCSFTGGDGGDSGCPKPGLNEPAGTGGIGIDAWGATVRVLVTGNASHVLAGGAGGFNATYGTAPDGEGLRLGGGAVGRVSGASVQGTYVWPGSSLETPVLPDPTLRLLEAPVAGANLTLRVVAPPGSAVRLRIGSQPVVVPSGGTGEDELVARAKSLDLGLVPPEGIVGGNFLVPPTWPAGTTVFAQAVVVYPGGEARRTSSIPIVVR